MAATHNGTCQCCGSIQAVTKRGLANHGYTVDYGFFNGICQGANKKPLEEDHTETDKIIVALEERIKMLQDALDNFNPETSKMMFSVPTGERWKTKIEWYTAEEARENGITEYTIKYGAPERTVYNYTNQIKGLTSHKEMMIKLKEERFGQPLYEREVKPARKKEYFNNYREAYARVHELNEQNLNATVRRQRHGGWGVTFDA